MTQEWVLSDNITSAETVVQTFIPICTAAIASTAELMPTVSAPNMRRALISAGGSDIRLSHI